MKVSEKKVCSIFDKSERKGIKKSLFDLFQKRQALEPKKEKVKMRKFLKYVFTLIKVVKLIKSGWAPLFPPPYNSFHLMLSRNQIDESLIYIFDTSTVIQRTQGKE